MSEVGPYQGEGDEEGRCDYAVEVVEAFGGLLEIVSAGGLG